MEGNDELPPTGEIPVVHSENVIDESIIIDPTEDTSLAVDDSILLDPVEHIANVTDEVAVDPVVDAVGENYIPRPSVDLEWYSENYFGLARVQRLEYIADNFCQMRIEALKLALTYLRGTHNVEMYKKLRDKLIQALKANDSSEVTDESLQKVLDSTWFYSKRAEFTRETAKLLRCIQSYKDSNVYETVKIGYIELGDHLLNGGDFNGALLYYHESLSYCTRDKHFVGTYISKIKANILMRDWTAVLDYISEVEQLRNFSEVMEMHGSMKTQLKCAAGIAELGLAHFEAAAKHFLQMDVKHFDVKYLISPYNVATYAGLCALATFERPEMRQHFIQKSPFKEFLEFEPVVDDIIRNFYNSKYSLCLTKLSELKDNLMIDMYFAPHVEGIFKEIRIRGILQYFSTYSNAYMVRMADAFNTTYEDLSEELIDLIIRDRLPARIDRVNKLLVFNEPDYEAETYERVLKVCDRFEKDAQLIMIRALFKEHNVLITE